MLYRSRHLRHMRLQLVVLVALFAILKFPAHAQECLPQWVFGEPMPGTDNTVLCSVVWTPRGADEPWLVIGGKFRVAGNVLANGIAAWDGKHWHSFGSAITDSDFFEVNALEVYQGDLYAAGWFDGVDGLPISHIARWDGTHWLAVGEGVNGWTPRAARVQR